MLFRWVPDNWKEKYSKYCEWSAWYSGEFSQVENYYKKGVDANFHVPIAGDIATTSANLLFGEAPVIRVDANAKTQERLDEIINRGDFISKLIESAESCSAMGGVFLKPNWDYDFQPYPVLSVVQVDQAIPKFKWGYLIEVDFWTEVKEDKEGAIYRLFENHTAGFIRNRLFKGDKSDQGVEVALESIEETSGMLPEISTGLDTIAVRYVPNMRPNNLWRGSALGKSDYSGSEDLMANLDMVYSSWMKDIRLGQGRAVVPQSWLERDENGNMVFDTDTEIFTTLDVDPLAGQSMGITAMQFAIRVEEHKQTALQLIRDIVNKAGYSPQSFGLDIEGKAESGTALNVRERKTIMTRSKKQMYWKSAVEDILEMMLTIDSMNGGGVELARPELDFQDNMAFDLGAISSAVDTLNRAQALSVKTKVQMVHPDWSKEMIEEEVQAIMDETGVASMEVDGFNGDFSDGEETIPKDENRFEEPEVK